MRNLTFSKSDLLSLALLPIAQSEIGQRPNRPHGAGASHQPLGPGAGAILKAQRLYPRHISREMRVRYFK